METGHQIIPRPIKFSASDWSRDSPATDGYVTRFESQPIVELIKRRNRIESDVVSRFPESDTSLNESLNYYFRKCMFAHRICLDLFCIL